jgi:hypothetical protein
MDDLGKMNLYGLGGDIGAPFPMHCPKCKKLLTIILLNDKCVIDIEAECRYCGGKAVGKDLRAVLEGTTKYDDDKESE